MKAHLNVHSSKHTTFDGGLVVSMCSGHLPQIGLTYLCAN